jgi:ArsR family transcriptional regulator
MTLSHQNLAQTFSALGHPRRVEVFEHLLRHATSGANFGEIQRATDMPASTLTHHLHEMERGGLVARTVTGRSTNLKLDLTYLQQTLNQLMSMCCSGTSGEPQ